MRQAAADNSAVTRQQLVALLKGGQAHATLEDAVHNLPLEKTGVVPDRLPYSIWQLVEHIRITQEDIVEFSRSKDHVSPRWPEGFWPKQRGPQSKAEWNKSLRQIKHDLDIMLALVENPSSDLFTPFPYGDGQNLLREAMLIADHTGYHVGQIIVIRRLLDVWEG